jgi:hypothetical protein
VKVPVDFTTIEVTKSLALSQRRWISGNSGWGKFWHQKTETARASKTVSKNPRDYRNRRGAHSRRVLGYSRPGCTSISAHKHRKVAAFVPELDFVAEVDGKIVGNIIYSS